MNVVPPSFAYIAIFASAITCLFWTYGVSRLGPIRAGQVREVPTLAQTASAALVLSGIAFVEGAREHHPATANTIEFPMKNCRANPLDVSLLFL